MHNWEHHVRLYHHLERQLHRPHPRVIQRAVRSAQYINRGGHYLSPPGHLQHPVSQEGQEDHQGPQPPEPWPVHPTPIEKVETVQVHKSCDQETDKQFLSPGHQTVKQSPLAGLRSITCTEPTSRLPPGTLPYTLETALPHLHCHWTLVTLNHVYLLIYPLYVYILYVSQLLLHRSFLFIYCPYCLYTLKYICIYIYTLGRSSPECRLAESRDITDRVWQNIYLYCSNYVGNQ
jgi:hypothetical protein